MHLKKKNKFNLFHTRIRSVKTSNIFIYTIFFFYQLHVMSDCFTGVSWRSLLAITRLQWLRRKSELAKIITIRIYDLYIVSHRALSPHKTIENATKFFSNVCVNTGGGGFNFARWQRRRRLPTGRDAPRRHTRPAYQAEKFLSFRRTHLLQIDGNDGSNSGLDEFFALAHARITPVGVRAYKYIYIYIYVYLCTYIVGEIHYPRRMDC